jgi:2-oxo-4-hydroxy-4-carboxy--5-ureidoimidazoline (OHCU) decarboxylase
VSIDPPPITELNNLSRAGFLAALTPLFEWGGILGGLLWEDRPYASYEELLDRAESLCSELDENEKLEIVNSHPRLGENADRLKRLSQQSYDEQGYGVSEPEAERLAREELWRLNAEYEARHGFRFVIFVNRRPPSALLEALRRRIDRKRHEELAEALAAVFAISRDRIGGWRQPE